MNGDGQPQLDAMSSEFVAEIKDDLASLEPDLLVMEEKGADADADLINHAFRAIHSIKGGAGFIDFKSLSNLSHAMENVLMRVREKKLVITPSIVDALLSGFDKMKLMVELLGTDQTCENKKEIKALENILKEEVQEAINQEQHPSDDKPEKVLEILTPLGNSPYFEGKTFFVDKKRLETALGSQKFIYAVHIRFEEDLKVRKKDPASMLKDIESIGDVLYSGLDESPFCCVISTILDLPLLSQVLEIDTSQMALMDKQFTDCEKILKSISEKAAFPTSEVSQESDEQFMDSEIPGKAESQSPASSLQIQPTPSTAQSGQNIRINMDLVSKLMNRAGELVLSRNQLRSFMEAEAAENTKASHMMQNLDMVTTEIQESIMQMRMQPVIDLLGKYKRVVRDIARKIDKKVDLVLEGAEVEVDRNVLEKLANPLTHLIRNCVDHGIETPEERKNKGKPEIGTILIKTAHQGGHVHFEISDDGAGIDPQLVLSKAFEKSLVSEDEVNRLTDKQKVDLIFLPGFSTSPEITDISGRGVGMDVVKTNIERLRGQIEIDSVMGQGTTIQLIIPLTLAIVPSLIVSSGESKFAIPQANIKEVIYLEPGKIHKQVGNIAGSEVLRLREHLVPILRLRNVLGLKTYIKPPGETQKLEEKRRAIADRRQEAMPIEKSEKRVKRADRRKVKWDSTYVILLKLGVNLFGLCVDELHDIEEVVVEPLNECIKHLKCFAGATILGDGDVIMILDVPGIAVSTSLKFDTIKKEEIKQNRLREKAEENKGDTKDLIVFGNTPKEYFAMELKRVARLEPVNPSDIHQTETLKYLEYNRQAVLLYSMEEFFPASPCDLSGERVFVIFPKNLSSKVGIMASKIVDTIQTNEKISKDAACPDAVLGKIFVEGRMIQVLDYEKMIPLIEEKTRAERSSQ